MRRLRQTRRITILLAAMAAGTTLALAFPAGAESPEDGETDATTLQPAEPAPESSPDPEIDEIVVTASSAPRKRSDVTSSVNVIGGAEIELQHYDNVPELLRRIPGVHIEQPGSRGGRSSIYMRGLDPNQTVVLVDGIRMNDPNNNLGGSFDLSTLDTDNVERIEIVRGPLSAVHGSDALAGAINVITKTGRSGDQVILDGSGGRFGYGRGLAVVRGQRGIFDASVSGSFVDDGKAESDGTYRAGALNSSFGVELPDDAELRATLRFVDSRSRAYPEASGGEKFAVIRDRDKREAYELSAGLRFDQQVNESLDYVIGVNYFRRREERNAPPIAAPPGNPFGAIPAQEANDLLYRTRVNANTTAELLPGLSLTGGGDVTFESGNSVSDLDFGFFTQSGSYSKNRIVGGPFVEGIFEHELGLIVQAGVRADFGDDTDSEWTPRVGASYRVPETPLTLRGSWGGGFKLPAFYSLADSLIGNPDLDAEKSKGWDVGADAVFWDGRVRLSAAYFEIRVKDLIDFDFGTFQLVNRDRVSSKGVEIGLTAELPWNLTFSGSLTRVKTNIRNSSDRLRRRPRWRAAGGMNWSPHERVSVGLDWVWVGSVYDESNPTGEVKLDDHVRFDARGEVRVWREVSVYLAIDNLFDESYQEAVGVPAMGIRPRAGVRAVF
jgi:vitamin B12 transporter